MGVISAANLSIVNSVYQLIFVLSAMLVGLNRTKWSIKFQSFITNIIIAILVIDLVGQYGFYIRSFFLSLSLK